MNSAPEETAQAGRWRLDQSAGESSRKTRTRDGGSGQEGDTHRRRILLDPRPALEQPRRSPKWKSHPMKPKFRSLHSRASLLARRACARTRGGYGPGRSQTHGHDGAQSPCKRKRPPGPCRHGRRAQAMPGPASPPKQDTSGSGVMRSAMSSVMCTLCS